MPADCLDGVAVKVTVRPPEVEEELAGPAVAVVVLLAGVVFFDGTDVGLVGELVASVFDGAPLWVLVVVGVVAEPASVLVVVPVAAPVW